MMKGGVNSIKIIVKKRNGETMKTKNILSNIFIYFMIFTLMAFSASAATATLVNLGEAGNFAVLSKTAISSVPTSVITGEVGISPAAGTYITGLTCPEVTGTDAFPIHVPSGASRPCDVVDPAYLTTVIGDMEIAYGAAQAQPNGVGPFLNIGAGNMIAQTLTPGVYTWGSDVLITDDLTLDCLGDSSAVFVFQIISGGKLELSAGKQIILAGNCQSGNIFWAVEGLTNLLVGSHLEGTVLGGPATSEMTLITGASVNGRLLGEKTIALDANTITMPVSVPAPVLTTITLTPASANLSVSSTQQMNATGFDQFNATMIAAIDYATDNSSIATVDLSGLVTAVDYGSVTVTASSGNISATSTITVEMPVLTTITLSPASANVTIGFTQQFTAESFDQFNDTIAATIIYDSSNTSIATVDTNGLVTAVETGDVVITASDGVISASSTVTVPAAPVLTTMTLLPVSVTFATGSTQQMNAEGFDQFSNPIVATFDYVTDNSSIATVDTNGLVTTFTVGTVTITASNGTVSASSTITTEDPVLTTITLSTSTSAITVGATQQMNVETLDQFGSPIAALVDYNTSNSSIATVDTSGLITSTGNYGSAIITATSGVMSASSTITVVLSVVDLGSADNFVILAKSGISTTGVTSITGNIGVSPIDSTAITGFGLILDSSNQFATSSLVVGNVYAADYAVPTPSTMTTAISDMETAYTDAAGRTNPTATELGAGNIGGLTMTPGLYKWSSGVTIPTDLTLDCLGDASGVFIFQIAGTLDISSATSVILSGSCQEANIFWQVADTTTLGTTSVFSGTILDMTLIEMNTGAVLNGRAYAQTAVTLQANTISTPTAPVLITSFTLSNTSVLMGEAITGSCTATVNSVPNATTVIAGVDTSSAGSKTATCTATDSVGNVATSFAVYTVTEVSSGGSNSGGGGGGGGSSSDTITCTDWTVCSSDKIQTRSCTQDYISTKEIRSCPGSTVVQNLQTQSNSGETVNTVQVVDEPKSGNLLTGQAVSDGGSDGSWYYPQWMQNFFSWVSGLFGGN